MRHPSMAIVCCIAWARVSYASESGAEPRRVMVQTFYEGVVPYALHPRGCYVREGQEADRQQESDAQFSQKFLGPFRETAAVAALRSAISGELGGEPTPEQVWEAFRAILRWMRAHRGRDVGCSEPARAV